VKDSLNFIDETSDLCLSYPTNYIDDFNAEMLENNMEKIYKQNEVYQKRRNAMRDLK